MSPTGVKNEIASLTGARIRELRIAHGWSQREFAERAGWHRPLVARIESGRHTPSVTSLLELAVALEVPISMLVDVLDHGPRARLVRTSVAAIAGARPASRGAA